MLPKYAVPSKTQVGEDNRDRQLFINFLLGFSFGTSIYDKTQSLKYLNKKFLGLFEFSVKKYRDIELA